jgi:hypothetical protein
MNSTFIPSSIFFLRSFFPPPPLFFIFLLFIVLRPLIVLRPKLRSNKETREDFMEVEMEVDHRLFEGDVDEITPGIFISYQYAGEYTPGGVPISPKISFSYSFCSPSPLPLHLPYPRSSVKIANTF